MTIFKNNTPEEIAASVAVSNLIQHNGAEFLPLNDAPAQVHFCTSLITMPYAPLQNNGFRFKPLFGTPSQNSMLQIHLHNWNVFVSSVFPNHIAGYNTYQYPSDTHPLPSKHLKLYQAG